MIKITSCLMGVGLIALALTGCTSPVASDDVWDPTTRLDADQPLEGEACVSTRVSPVDESTLHDEEFWVATQGPLALAAGSIEEQFPDEFAYDFFDDRSTLHVGFKATAPAEAVGILEDTDLPYVVIEAVGFNAADYQAATDKVSEQTKHYVTEDRTVTIGQEPRLSPPGIVIGFHSDDPWLTKNPGLEQSLEVDPRFRILFDFTDTSPIVSPVFE
jgi:hypothetical protein